MAAAAEIAERLAAIRARIGAACARAGRSADQVTLIGVSKTQPADAVAAALAAGLDVFGENRVQEAVQKAAALPSRCRWHLIGPLQTNKAKVAAERFDVIHSVDRLKVAQALEREAERLGRRIPCFLEVNLGAEPSKHGFGPDELLTALPELAACSHLELRGLMAIPPFGDEPEQSRPWFVALRELAANVAATGRLPDFRSELSMGMSDDFEVAIEEGATHVRVGTALFGPRQVPETSP